MEATRLIVEVRDPQALPGWILLFEATREERPRSGEAVEFDGDVGTLMTHRVLLMDASPPDDANRVGFGA
jgi:hypothetical protein